MSNSNEIQTRVNAIMENIDWLIDNNMLTANNPANGENFDIAGVHLNKSCISINLISNKIPIQ